MRIGQRLHVVEEGSLCFVEVGSHCGIRWSAIEADGS
jgi:hypothetical protein